MSLSAEGIGTVNVVHTAHDAVTDGACADSCSDGNGTWVMQTDAAARTGFSVSAIRKWRRMGLVADRKITSTSGLERVEVRLEDVLAKAALQPDRRRGDSDCGGVHAPPGTVVIAVDDLEALFERMVSAQRRAEEAEAVAGALRAEATFTRGQLAELRRQRQDAADLSAVAPEPEAAQPTPPSRGAARPAGAKTVESQPPAVRSGVRRLPPTAPPPAAPVRALPFDQASGGDAPPPRPRTEELADELRRLYARLDEYRRQPVLTPDAERRHGHDLAEYDRTLLALCERMSIPTGLPPGEPVGAEVRASLTRTLARAGLDVRTVASGSSPSRHQPKRRV